MPSSRSTISALLGAALVVTACGSGGGLKQYGDYPSLRPTFTIPDQHPPLSATVNVGAPSYVAVLYVVPGVGASVVYPADSTVSNRVAAGQSQIPLAFPRTGLNRDSILAASRERGRRGGGGAGMPPGRGGRPDTTYGGTGPLRTPSPTSIPEGYILLVASPDSLSYSLLKRRVEGITIPAEDNEALNTVVKLVRATLPDRTTWAAAAKDVEIR